MDRNINKYILLCLVVLIIMFAGGCEDLLTDLGNDDSRERITGSWICDESEGYLKSLETYPVEIYLHPDDSTRVLIFNFFNLDPDISAEAILSGSRLILPGQTLEGGFTISGSGLISKSNAQIDWEYTVNDGSGEDYELTALYTKQ